MSNQNPLEKSAKKVLPIIYVLDTSGSMCGEKIASVNEAMYEMEAIWEDIECSDPDFRITIDVLSFSTGARWITEKPVARGEFLWQDIEAYGETDLGQALIQLKERLEDLYCCSNNFEKVCYPVIIFISDGQPTDEYESALMNLNTESENFAKAIKIAVAVGDDADENVLVKVIGGIYEALIRITDYELLRELIQNSPKSFSKVFKDNDESKNSFELAQSLQKVIVEDLASQKKTEAASLLSETAEDDAAGEQPEMGEIEYSVNHPVASEESENEINTDPPPDSGWGSAWD